MKSKTVACVIARTVSTRLPLKVLRNIVDGYSMLDFIIQRLKLVENIDEIYICTSVEAVDDIMEDVAEKNNVSLYRGSPDQVIERLISVGELSQADNIIRITGDNVFTSYEYLNQQIELHNSNSLDYTRVIGVPVGATAEVMSLKALKKCYESIDPAVSEYLLLYMFSPAEYKCGVVRLKSLKESSDYTITVDTLDDYVRTKNILKLFSGDPLKIELKEIIQLIDEYQIENSKFNSTGTVKMPYGKETTFENFQLDMTNRIEKSNKLLIG